MSVASPGTESGLRRGLGLAGDFAGLMGLALFVPFAILAFGLPLVLLIKAVLWIFGMQ
jgi:hypothetical protein